jgi:hypothetical protein
VYWTLFVVYGSVAVVLLAAWLADMGTTFLRSVLWPLYLLRVLIGAVFAAIA